MSLSSQGQWGGGPKGEVYPMQQGIQWWLPGWLLYHQRAPNCRPHCWGDYVHQLPTQVEAAAQKKCKLQEEASAANAGGLPVRPVQQTAHSSKYTHTIAAIPYTQSPPSSKGVQEYPMRQY